jgi:3-deoxy-manno-octulosonate cytidylyltransferase (CMP-KDO synthetase)
MPKVAVVIPARWGSSRFPGKPLAQLAGLPLIRRVWDRAILIPEIYGVFVATDCERIFKVVRDFGGNALMTSQNHESGTDRLAEAAEKIGLFGEDVVVNVQGDQPCLNPVHATLLAEALLTGQADVATLAVPMTDPAEIANPNHVKTVFDLTGRALYFSRSPIPFYRDEGKGEYFKHVGLYAYRVDFLRQFVKWPRSKLETAEKLEQLRILERGLTIQVIVSDGLSPEVDAPEDLAVAEAALKLL